MMLLSLSVFRFWKWSWSRSCRKWLMDVGLPRLVWPGRPGSGSQPLARSRQQLQQSRPMGERHSSFDIRSSSSTWESDGSRDRFSSTCSQVVKHTSLVLKCHGRRSRSELILLDCVCESECVCVQATQVFMSRRCLFSCNDAAGVRKKCERKTRSCFCLLFFFFLAVPCPALFPAPVRAYSAGGKRGGGGMEERAGKVGGGISLIGKAHQSVHKKFPPTFVSTSQ